MSIKSVRSFQKCRPAAPALLLATALTVIACAGIGNVTSAVGSAATAAAAISSQAASPGGAATPGATAAAAAGGSPSTTKCQTIGAAFIDFEAEYPFLGIASDSGYATNTPDSPTYINIPKLRADLDGLGPCR